MVASGVGQFSINVKSNLKDFYGELTKSQRTLKELTDRKNQLNIDSSKLTELRDKAQRIAAEMKELRQQKTEIKLGTREVDDAKAELKNLDQQIASLNRQKLEVEADIQPIRTANVELYKTEQEIDRINGQKVSIDFSQAGDNLVGFGDKLDGLSDKILNVVKVIGGISIAGIGGAVSVLKDAVNEASDLEQNIGGVQKLFGDNASKKVIDDSAKAYKEAGISQNEYLEQSTTFSASLIKALEQGQTKTSDSSSQKSDLEKKKAEIEKQIKQNSYNSSEAGLNTTDSKAKKQELNKYKQNALDLKKQKDKIDEQIANLPGKTTEQVNKLSQEDAQKQAADYANQAIVDMSDNANVFGTNIGLIQNAYQGFSKNNFTMLDNLKLGFAGSQQGAMDLINTYGGLDHKVTDISEVTMPLMIKSIHNAQEAMKISGTTTKEAAKTYEGSLNAMKSAWKDFLATGDATGLAETVPVYFDNLDKKLKELTPKIIEGIKTLVKELPPKIKPVIKDIQNILTQSLDEIFGKGFTKNFTDGMKPFTNTIKTIFDTLSKSSKGKKPDLSWMGSVIPDLLKVAVGLKVAGVAFKGVGGLLKGVGFIQNLGFKLPSFKGLNGFTKSTKEIKQIGVNDLKSLGMKMLTIAGISANIYLAAKALEEVQKVGDLKGLQPKLLAIAEAVVGMGILAAAAGFIAEKKPDLLISGLIAVAGISGTIYLAAKALQEVGDIDSDFGSVQSKIGQMALSITEIGLLAAAVGALMDTGVGAAVLASGLLAIVGIAGTIYLVAKALEEVSNLELNKKVIDNNLKTISEVLVDITGMAFDGNIFDQVADILSQLLNLALIGELLGIGKELEQLQEIELDRDKVLTSITAITDSLSYISELTKDPTLGDIIGEAGKLIKNLIDLMILDEFIKISGQLKQLENVELNDGKIEGTIKSIKSMIEQFTQGSFVDSLKGFLTGGIKIGDLKAAYGIFSEFSKIADVLEDLQGRSLMEDSLLDEIGIIKNAVMSISSFSTGEIASNLTGLADALDRVINDLTKTYPPEFQDLGKLLAQKTNEGFKSKLDLQSILSSKVKSLSTAGASGIGSSIAKAISSGFDKSLNLGDKIHNSIIKALSSEYSAKINVDLLTNKVDNSKSPSTKYPTVVMASGGRVATDSQLQDSPEKPVLGNGEYVIPKKIVNALGVPFFDKLRSGQISRTFAGLAQSVSNTTSSVVNNIYNTTNNHQNMNVYAGAGQDVQMIANRRLRG